ncbi:MAG: ferrochelatase [Alphaproteobacteria bacterium]
MTRTAVVLFNLGGPDRPESVRPFLFNLFSDPAILAIPGPLRRLLAWFLSVRRAPVAREIYSHLGGGSPLLANTNAQAARLAEALGGEEAGFRVFIAMRYWHPRSDETAAAVKAFDPDTIVLLPLYPQFSTTTSASSLADWHRAAAAAGLDAPTKALCCYPTAPGLVEAMAKRVQEGLAAVSGAGDGQPRVLFSAHGLPKRVVARGDPYQWQVERTAAAVVERLAKPGLDWVVCYQSRVGPLEWIGPATDEEIARAGDDAVPVVLAPVAFVSEHSETLVELDIEYRRLAEKAGVPTYVRVATVSTAGPFIEALAGHVRGVVEGEGAVAHGRGERTCPVPFGRCPLRPAPGAG